MSKAKLLFFVFMFGVCSFATAQKDTIPQPKNWIIKVDLFYPIYSWSNVCSVYDASAERYLGHNISLQIAGFYGSGLLADENYSDFRTKNDHFYAVGPEVKYYFNKSKQNAGFYVGMSAFFQHGLDIANNPFAYRPYIQYMDYLHNNGYGMIVIGFQYSLSKRIVVDVMGGLGVEMLYSASSVNNMNFGTTSYNGLLPAGIANVNIGYRF